MQPVAESSTSVLPLGLYTASVAVDAAAIELCANLTPDQLCWSPRPGVWSIGENLSHLRITTEVFLPAVDAAIAASRQLHVQSPGLHTLNLFGRAMVWRMESRPMIRMQAPRAVWPRPSAAPASELQSFLRSQQAIRERMESCQGVPLTALRFPSPLMRCVRVNLLEFFAISNAHARRHLRQAGNVRRVLPQAKA